MFRVCLGRVGNGRVGNGRVGWIDRFVWEGVCVAIFILKACSYLCNNYFYKLVLIQNEIILCSLQCIDR